MPEPSLVPPIARTPSVATLIAGSGVAVLGLLGAVFANTDALVTRGFSDAIASASPVTRTVGTPSGPAISGSEEFWLSRAVNGAIKPAAWQPPREHASAIGQRFTLTANGAARTLEIVDVRALAAAGDGAANQAGSMLLVTARDTADASAAPVRLVLEPGQTLPGLPAITALHAL